jgi:hypothetical protein
MQAGKRPLLASKVAGDSGCIDSTHWEDLDLVLQDVPALQ